MIATVQPIGVLLKNCVPHASSLEALLEAGRFMPTNVGALQAIWRKYPSVPNRTRNTTAAIFVSEGRDTDEQIIQHIKSLGYQPAALEELLLFGTQYPDRIATGSVYALGSYETIKGYAGYPFLKVGSQVEAGVAFLGKIRFASFPKRARFLMVCSNDE